MYQLIIRNAQIANPDGSSFESDLACNHGRIEKIAPEISTDAVEQIDAKGQLLLPGVIDPQVHFREPGGDERENLASGSRAAVRGGVTSFLEMPNCKPPTTDQEQLSWKIDRASKTSVANFGFFIGATSGNLRSLNDAQPACGIKIFMGSSTGDLLVDDEKHLDQIFGNGSRLIAVHAEDETRIQDRTKSLLDGNENPDCSIHSIIRDPQTALIATERALSLSKKYERRLHVLHLSTAEEVKKLRQDKPDWVSCEVIPNHLFLNTDDYQTLGSRVQMNPPIRDPENTPELWAGLHDGTIDIIATDHAPHLLSDKGKPYPYSPSGMPGVETSLPLMLTAMQEGKCDLAQIQKWMCSGPAALYGIPNKGVIREGFDADLTLVNLDVSKVVSDEEVFSKVKWSPFSGRALTGWPIYTIVGGNIVFDNGIVRDNVYGKALTYTSQ